MQSRLPGASQHYQCFPPRSRANAFCHNRLQTCIAGASQQIGQRLRSTDNEDDSALLRSPQFFEIEPLVHSLPTSSSKSAPIPPRNRGNRDPTAATQKPPYRKNNTGFRARHCFPPWVHRFLNWCWHDDDKTAPGHSSVARKFSN